MKRRILAMFLCVVMIFSLTVSSYAERAEEVVEVPHVVMNIDEEMQSSDDVATVDVNVNKSPEQNEESRDEAVCEDESTGDVSETEGSTDAENIDMSIENSDTTCQEDGTNEDSIQENVSQESEEESEGTLNEGGNETESETEPETTPTGKWEESQSVPGKSENAETADQIPDEEATDGEVNITPDTEESNSVPEETEPEATEPEGTEPEGVKTEGTEPERDEGPAAELETASDSNPKYDGCEYCGADADEEHAADCITNCTCSCENGEHAEDCPLYDGPECTCEFLSHIHEKECELYVEPIPAKVYMEENGEYTLVEEHNADKPFDVRAYDDQTLYVVSTEYPQNLYFERNKKFLGSDYGANYTISNKEYCKLDVYNQAKGDTYKNASLTLAGDIPADMEVTLTATTVLKDFWIEDWVDTEYTITIRIIDELPTEEEVVKKETLVDGTAISAEGTGIPETVTLTASAVSSEEYHSEIGNFIEDLSNLLFAYDITLLDADGELWQPESGEKVTVTLDVSDMEVENGDKIGILHDHDGTLSKLGEYTVTDGMITFETDGFSVFYGYTVDFEYDGVSYSMDGGNYIYLSELFEELKISRDVNEVSEVSFSDATLIVLTHFTYIDEEGGGQDWRISSLEPFDTEETLKIVFNDGEEISIRVLDKNWGTEDIDGNETWADTDTQGNRKVTANSTITINKNATITLNGTITVPEGKTLTIQCIGNAELKRGTSNEKDVPLFQVDGGKLIIQSTSGTITVDGNKIAVGRAAFVVGITKSGTDKGGSTLELTNVIIKNCYSDNQGYAGAIDLLSGSDYRPLHSLIMNNCVIDNCQAPHGSAIYFRGNSMGQALITDTVIKNCVTYGKNETDGDDQGGTIRSNGQNGSFVVFERCILKNNRSGYSTLDTLKSGSRCYGGAIYWNAAGKLSTSYKDTIDTANLRAKMYIYDCQIVDNKTTNRGGGIFNESNMYIGTRHMEDFLNERVDQTSNIKGTLIDGNVAEGCTANNAFNCGGGIMVPSYGGGAEESQDMDVTLNVGRGVFITNNKSDHGGGLAMQINETDDKEKGVTFTIKYDGAVMQKNESDENGGGIYIRMTTDFYNSQLDLVSGMISENKARNGGGIYVENTNINIGTSETTTDNPIKVEKNVAMGDGGGIYLNQEKAYADSVQINVSNGFVSDNQADGNGGGIYQTGICGNCIVTGAGEIKNNIAANGGGIYISGGSSLMVSGGSVSFNKAICNENVNHISNSGETVTNQSAFKDAITCGVGGGIYVANGTANKQSSFNMTAAEGSKVGIHSNTASYAAADVYSSGLFTQLTLPNVSGMDLADYNGEATAWYVDYCAGDENYPKLIINSELENPGRYDIANTANVVVEVEKLQSTATYFCLTLGKTYGELKITKKLVNEQGLTYTATEDQSFLFHVQNADQDTEAIDLTVIVTVKKGQSEASITISHIPEGKYKITEDQNWGWRFEVVVDAGQGWDSESEVEIAYTSVNPESVFANKPTEDQWLSYDCYVENWFSKGGIVKRDEENQIITEKQPEV